MESFHSFDANDLFDLAVFPELPIRLNIIQTSTNKLLYTIIKIYFDYF